MTATLPATLQTWQIDPTHSAVNFAVKHMVFATVRGQFGDVSGSITIDQDDLRTTTVDIAIGTGSVDTRMPQRDEHLKSADFFDAAQFPKATFVGAGATPKGDGSWALPGTLTIKGTAKPVTLVVRPQGAGKDPWGNTRSAWSASVTIDRREFGLNWNQALEAGGLLVSNDVEITMDVQAVQG
jgi:polyisoprenoid-binding protein YceI